MPKIHPAASNDVVTRAIDPNPSERVRRSGICHHPKTLYHLGIIQIILGSFSFILGLTCVLFADDNSESLNLLRSEQAFLMVGGGLWCGSLILLSGVFGILSGSKTRPSYVVAAMVLGILAAVFAAAMIGVEITSILVSLPGLRSMYHYEKSKLRHTFVQSGSLTLTTLHGFLSFAAVAELVIAIFQSVFCCTSLCCQFNEDPSNISAQNPIINQPLDDSKEFNVSEENSLNFDGSSTSPTEEDGASERRSSSLQEEQETR